MKILKAYQFRLKTTAEIENKFLQFSGCCRSVWNKVLEISLQRLEAKQKIIWYHEADFWVKLWKQSNEYNYLNSCPAQALQQKLKDLDKAFRDGFDKTQILKRMPTFRKRGLHDSFRYPQHFKLDHRRIFLPKIGWVSFFKSQVIAGTPKNVTVRRKAKHWYVSIQTEQERDILLHPATSAIGIDVGIAKFAAISDGEMIEGIAAFKAHEKKLSWLQRMLAKKVKFSMNWRKQKERVSLCFSKIANVRKDFLHKVSTRLSKNHAMIVVEDLKITNMSKSAQGTIEKPGRNVKAKSGLNKAILDQGWGEFKRQLDYKLKWLGGYLVKVSPHYTSQTCSSCGCTLKENRLTQSLFKCIKCFYTDNADTNAAKNILAAGHAVFACGE
jgi:putative transposase